MIIPTGTYRLQFRQGMTFERAEGLIPYLRDLGVSHLYASPIMTAVEGSSHGYDVTNCNEIDPALGGRTGFDQLCRKLAEAGLSLVVDIVPNHMAASTENPWWADVLKFGTRSSFATYFDIDWSEKLTLPILGKPFLDAVQSGEIRLIRDEHGNPSLSYFDTILPLAPGSIDTIPDPESISGLDAVHNRQHWQLTNWKTASRHLSYRRFFEVTGLVGLKVEEPDVFEQSHRLILELVATGQVQGIRLDHIDGLADPAGYLARLRQAVGPDVYVVAEKILGPGEQIPTEWPIQGTTGYEFITALSNLFVEPRGFRILQSRYQELSAHSRGFEDELRAAKALMIDRNFEGEKNALVRIAMKASHGFDQKSVARAIRELLIAFPVYRTYGQVGSLNAGDATILRHAVDKAKVHCDPPQALEWLAAVLEDGSQVELRKRFQQLSGPIMAKAMEDTLFYRHNASLALNEVGGEPNQPPGGLDTFHALMEARLQSQPNGLSATSTHDTKRGEDARARLYALSEAPDAWCEGLKRWSSMNRKFKSDEIPDRELEWMLYQALAGCWPCETPSTDKLVDRFVAYTQKALREAKLSTNWNDPDTVYEDAVKKYASGLSGQSPEFAKDFNVVLRPLIAAGHVNSLSQTLIKLTAPGIPDIYQGSELGDFSLVDPDNRRPLDMLRLKSALDRQKWELEFGNLKQRIVQVGLRLRQQYPDLFGRGRYLPLAAMGRRSGHVIAFARLDPGGNFAVTVASRFMLGQIATGSYAAPSDFWDDTALSLPRGLDHPVCDIIASRALDPDRLMVSDVLASGPVALIVRGGTPKP
ncbi:malto-oligosyltrehalose synthase [Rhizobium cauense]|uniref:malto-oligosyltrehalose synthase n=1 Tax=Rhizobium cauense TaxID=1166683 RepID=UPI001C6ED24C|nr:malto-oligosyltrehalose synthase [Rhizobium cauense]MBW9117308.1 malto-oligosyltrehalose synthase [Rhizobium cauense]